MTEVITIYFDSLLFSSLFTKDLFQAGNEQFGRTGIVSPCRNHLRSLNSVSLSGFVGFGVLVGVLYNGDLDEFDSLLLKRIEDVRNDLDRVEGPVVVNQTHG